MRCVNLQGTFDKNQQTKLCVFQSEYREYLVFFRQILHRHGSTDIISSMKTRNYIKKQCYGLVLHNTATSIYHN